jgi:hypothetical protein
VRGGPRTLPFHLCRHRGCCLRRVLVSRALAGPVFGECIWTLRGRAGGAPGACRRRAMGMHRSESVPVVQAMGSAGRRPPPSPAVSRSDRDPPPGVCRTGDVPFCYEGSRCRLSGRMASRPGREKGRFPLLAPRLAPLPAPPPAPLLAPLPALLSNAPHTVQSSPVAGQQLRSTRRMAAPVCLFHPQPRPLQPSKESRQGTQPPPFHNEQPAPPSRAAKPEPSTVPGARSQEPGTHGS